MFDRRRESAFHSIEVRRGPSRIQRLVIVGPSGRLDLAVVPWCHSQGIALAQVSRAGDLLWVSAPPGRDDARLRRAQALAGAPDAELGLQIARDLVAGKVWAEDHCLRELGLAREPLLGEVGCIEDALAVAATVADCRNLEALSAASFWAVLEPLDVPFVTRDLPRIPAHWRTIGPRSSPLGGTGPRRAVSPFHAALNVIFASVELEATIACHAMGLDPGLGFLHLDVPRRPSLACDLMEPLRAAAVVQLLHLLRSRPLSLRDVVERPDGEVRCRPSLFQELWSQAPAWGRAVAPLAEHMAARITATIPAQVGGRQIEASTPLTGRRRRASGAQRRGWREPSTGLPRRPPALPHTCLGCGGPVRGANLRCSTCAKARHEEMAAELSRERLGRARGGGEASQREVPVGIRHGLSRLAEAVGWAAGTGSSGGTGDWEVALSQLQELGPARLGEVTGASPATVGRWLRGEAAPRPRWWDAIEGAAGRLAAAAV
jgi:hypothetical protein